jgi:hypothetical protein
MEASMPKDEKLLATAGDWLYVSCHVLVVLPTTGGATHTQQGGVCQLCGNSNVRFVHTLDYLPDVDAGESGDNVRRVEVGLDCAQILVGPDDAHIPVLAENETHRKRKWRIQYRRTGICTTTFEDLDTRGKL